MGEFLGRLGGIAATAGGLVVAFVVEGIALSTMWQWFVVPEFKTDPISVVNAIGISIIVGLLTRRTEYDDDTKKKSAGYKLAYAILVGILAPLFSLLFAWIVFQFK